MQKTKFATVDEYISAAPPHAQQMLQELREILKNVAPDAKEVIKWNSPVYEEKRILFSFSAFKDHINFMPTGTSLEPFKNELTEFRTGKDTIQLPYDKPLPKTLIKKIAEYRAREVREKDAKWMY